MAQSRRPGLPSRLSSPLTGCLQLGLVDAVRLWVAATSTKVVAGGLDVIFAGKHQQSSAATVEIALQLLDLFVGQAQPLAGERADRAAGDRAGDGARNQRQSTRQDRGQGSQPHADLRALAGVAAAEILGLDLALTPGAAFSGQHADRPELDVFA